MCPSWAHIQLVEYLKVADVVYMWRQIPYQYVYVKQAPKCVKGRERATLENRCLIQKIDWIIF